MYFKSKKRKTFKKPTTKETVFRFFNNHIQYVCVITAPVFVEKYRLKEVFDNTFVGLKEDITKMPESNNFLKLHQEITYKVMTAKEYETCQTQTLLNE